VVSVKPECSRGDGIRVPARTDRSGRRYFFCNLPRGNGCVAVTVPVIDEWDSTTKEVPIVISGDRVLDIDVSR